jgi:hypothetical protein
MVSDVTDDGADLGSKRARLVNGYQAQKGS